MKIVMNVVVPSEMVVGGGLDVVAWSMLIARYSDMWCRDDC